MGSDKDTSPSEFLVNSCSGTITSVAVLDLKQNVVMSNENFVHLCSQVGYGNKNTGLVHLQDLVSDAVTELVWRKLCLQQSYMHFNKVSDCVRIEGTMSYVVQDDKILWTTHSYTMLSSDQGTAPSNCTQGVNPYRAHMAASAPTEDAMAPIEHALAIAMSTFSPGADSTQHAKWNALNALEISDDWIDGLAAGPPPSWDKFRFDQQNLAKQKTAHTNSAEKRRWASEVDDAILRDQLLDALEANPSDQKVDMLLGTLTSEEQSANSITNTSTLTWCPDDVPVKSRTASVQVRTASV